MSILSLKLDEVSASYACKYNSIIWDFHVFHCISSICCIIMHFFEKYLEIKIKDHKILVLMSRPSSKLDEINASYASKYNSILWDFYVFHCRIRPKVATFVAMWPPNSTECGHLRNSLQFPLVCYFISSFKCM